MIGSQAPPVQLNIATAPVGQPTPSQPVQLNIGTAPLAQPTPTPQTVQMIEGVAAVLPQLQAYHDDELRVADQIAVTSHVDGCTSCHEALTELQTLGDTLRTAAPGRTPLACDEAAGFTSTVVNRARVEDDASLLASMRFGLR